MTTSFMLEPEAHAFEASSQGFKNRCYTFLVVLCNDKDFDRIKPLLDPQCTLIHEDNPPVKGAEAFVETWKTTLKKMPDYHKVVKDIMVEMPEETRDPARVWVYSQITGISSNVRDSIDMMHFTADGLFLDSKDVQRELKVTS